MQNSSLHIRRIKTEGALRLPFGSRGRRCRQARVPRAKAPVFHAFMSTKCLIYALKILNLFAEKCNICLINLLN